MVESYPITQAPNILDCVRRLIPYNSSNSWHSRYKHLKMESRDVGKYLFPGLWCEVVFTVPLTYRLHLSTLNVTICGVESKIPVNCEPVASISYKQRRFKSFRASAQSDQSLSFPPGQTIYSTLGYPKSAHRRLCSDCADVRSDLSLRWSQIPTCTYFWIPQLHGDLIKHALIFFFYNHTVQQPSLVLDGYHGDRWKKGYMNKLCG